MPLIVSYRLLCVVLLALLSACATPKSGQEIVVRSINPIGFSWQEFTKENPPREFTLSLQVENHGTGVTLRKGEGYIFYRGRKVAILNLQEKAEFMGHRNSQVLLTLRCNIAHNSHSMALMESLKRHSAEDISVGWRLKVRRGILHGKVEQEPIPLERLLSPKSMERLWQMVEEIE